MTIQNLKELSETLKPFSYRVLKQDCLDLPEKTQQEPDELNTYLSRPHLVHSQHDKQVYHPLSSSL